MARRKPAGGSRRPAPAADGGPGNPGPAGPDACDPAKDTLLHRSLKTGRRYYCRMDGGGGPVFYSTEVLGGGAADPGVTGGAGFVMDDAKLGLPVKVRGLSAGEIQRALPGLALRTSGKSPRNRAAAEIARAAAAEKASAKGRSCTYEAHEWMFRGSEQKFGTIYAWYNCKECVAVKCEEFDSMRERIMLPGGREQKKRD